MRKFYSLFLLCCLPTIVIAKDTQNWQLILAEDPLSHQTACLMISATKQTDDGQTSTPVSLIFNGNVFIAKTKSNLDLSYQGIGLQVDDYEPHTIDLLNKDTNAVFETQAEKIREEFIKGLSGKLTLGFWPTWPKTKTYTTEFDLRGFTKTYEGFLRCQQTGEIR